MACGSCGARANRSMTQEYLITYRDGTTERVPADLSQVRKKTTLKAGTYRLVDKIK